MAVPDQRPAGPERTMEPVTERGDEGHRTLVVVCYALHMIGAITGLPSLIALVLFAVLLCVPSVRSTILRPTHTQNFVSVSVVLHWKWSKPMLLAAPSRRLCVC